MNTYKLVWYTDTSLVTYVDKWNWTKLFYTIDVANAWIDSYDKEWSDLVIIIRQKVFYPPNLMTNLKQLDKLIDNKIRYVIVSGMNPTQSRLYSLMLKGINTGQWIFIDREADALWLAGQEEITKDSISQFSSGRYIHL